MAVDNDGLRGRLNDWIEALWGPRLGEVAAAGPDAREIAVPDTARLEAVVAGLPDPVVVLDQDGRVVAYNPEASTLAPALRRGEPASIALRMPELIEAIRAAQTTGKSQRIELSARLPASR